MNTKNISIGVVAFLVLVAFFSVLKVKLVGSPALALRLGQPTYVNASKDFIVVDSVDVGDKIKSPLTITGKARGSWFYENAFPILIHDENGVPVGRGIALAEGTPAPGEFVPFKGIVTFEIFGQKGTVVLVSNDDPRGGSEGIRTVSIPVSFDR